MQDILIIEEIDVRRADDPDDTRVLTITKMGIPKLTRKNAEHTPGGGVGTVNFVLPMLDAFEPAFSTKGLDTDTLAKFGLAAGQADKWTFAATVRNTRLNKVVPLRCTIRGIVSEWSPGENTPGDLADCDLSIKEVTYVDLYIDSKELFAWGFYERIGRSGGVDWFAQYKTALGA